MMQIRRLGRQIGVEITGVDVKQLDDAGFARIYQAWLGGNVAIVRDQSLEIEDFLRYSRRFGVVVPHPSKMTRHPEHPDITLLGINLSVTGSTHAGMAAGFAAQDPVRRVIGIDASAKPRETLEQVTRIAQATAKLIDVGRELRRDELELVDRYHAGTYGIPDERTVDAIRLAARLEAMITDPVYEGKSMAGMIDLVARGEIPKESTVLYAHLGGQPALNAYSALFR